MSNTKLNNESEFYCEFCKKNFVKESTLISHSCEKKRRFMFRDEKYVKNGFFAYQKFYEMNYPKNKIKHKTYDEFMHSPFYTAFTRFGRYIIEMNAIEPEKFTIFLIKNSIPVDHWCLPEPYEKWVRELSRKESPEQALERSILLAESWAKETGNIWQNFFKCINVQLATKWIRTGRISPYLLYSKVGEPLMERLSDEQLDLISNLVEPEFWSKKIKDNQAEIVIIMEELKKAEMYIKES